RAGMEQINFGLMCVCIRDVAGDEKAAVRVVAHSLHRAASSLSSRTRFGKTRSPKMRLALASTSGQLTRFFFPLDRPRATSSKERTACKNFSRSGGDNALTCLSNSAALILEYYSSSP